MPLNLSDVILNENLTLRKIRTRGKDFSVCNLKYDKRKGVGEGVFVYKYFEYPMVRSSK